MIRVPGNMKVPVKSAQKRVWHEFWAAPIMIKEIQIRNLYAEKKKSGELLDYTYLSNYCGKDPRVDRTDMTGAFESLIILRTGFRIKADGYGEGHSFRTAGKTELAGCLEKIGYCYCSKCRKEITEKTLATGSTPEYLMGWIKNIG